LRGLLVFYLITATLTLGYGSVFTLLAEIRERFGFEDWAVGIIGGAGFAAGFIAQVGLARFADRGHLRLMLRAGLAIAGLGLAGMIVATELWEFVTARLLLGLGSGTFTPAVRRIAISRDPERAGEALGTLTAFEVGGWLVGPVLASVLNELFGFRSTFILLTALVGLLSPVLARLEVPAGQKTTERRVIRGLLRRRGVQASLCAALAFYTAVGVFEAIWAILLRDKGASQLFIGLTLSLFSLPMLFVAPRAGKLAQQRGPFGVLAMGIAGAIPCMALYGAVDQLAILTILVAVHSIADAFTMPANQLAIAQASPPDQLASGQGLMGAVGLATAAAAAFAGGFVYNTAGAVALFAGTAAFMLLCLLATLLLSRHISTAPWTR
jgi:predicted MFS family arabinose efflux permease